MILVPAFPPPSMTDPDDVGWPMCAAAAFWRQGRYEESLAEMERAATAAKELGLEERTSALVDAQKALSEFVGRWKQGEPEADPRSVPVSEEYPSIEVIEQYMTLEDLSLPHAGEGPSLPVLSTLPSGLFGNGARPPQRPRIVPPKQPEKPLVLDFEGSILQAAPQDDVEPETKRSSHPPRKR